MKSIKKFSAISVKDQSITESAKVTKEAVDELIKKIGFNSIDELKKEKDLLSKLEAMSKTFAKDSDISEDEIEEDRTEDIEDEIKAKGSPKSLEGAEDKGSDEEVVDAEVEEVEEEVEDDLVSDEQEITKEVPAEEDEVEDEGGVDVASEEKETPKATKRIMAFEDFIKEKETTVNKNINYRDDNEEEEDYAVPFAASADPLAEGAESKGKEDEKEGDELEDKGDKKVDSEDDKEKADHYKGAVKSDDKQIDALKKDAEYDKEEEEKNESTIMDFASFVNEAYDKVVFGGNKGDKSKTKEDEEDFEDEDKKDEAYDVVTLGGNKGDKSKTKKGEEDYEDDKDESVEEDRADDIEDEVNAKGKTKKLTKSVKEAFTFADAVDTAGEDVKKNEKGIASALKALKAKSGSDISIMTDTTEDDGLFDAIKGMKELSVNSSIYDNAYAGKYKSKDVVVFNDGNDLFAYVKEGVAEVITKIEGDEIADEEAGADGIAIPAMKGDGSETAAGIAGDIMNKGKVKNLSTLAGKLVTPDQKVTEVIPDEANDVSEDGIEIPLVKEEVFADDSIADKFRKIATNKLGKVNEAEITSADQFKEYAMKMLKDAFGADFDEAKATEVADGLISKYGEDYGAMVGALQSTMGS